MPPIEISITILYAAALTVLFVTLAFRVAMLRRKHKIGVGYGKEITLLRAKSAHENAADNTALALLLLLMLELQGVDAPLMHALGLSLLAARLMHAVGISRVAGHSAGRFYGILLTWALLCLMAGLNLYMAWR